MKRTIALLALIGATAGAFAAAEIGEPAPDFTGTDITGKTHRLSDYQGKIVVLESYNSDCPFCRNHFKTGAMQELQKQMTNRGVIWLMVNSVNPGNVSHRTPEQAKTEWEKEKFMPPLGLMTDPVHWAKLTA
jgi:peroxiredoxin